MAPFLRCIAPPTAALALALTAAAAQVAERPAAVSDDPDAAVAGWIRQLGAEQYAARERAQAELQRLGLRAFDALKQAQYDDDIEIALRARRLVASMQVRWSRESDPPEVKRILQRYGQEDRGGRKARLVRLASLAERRGVEALCRLSRFEIDPTLSKQAALHVMNQEAPADEEERRGLSQLILRITGDSKQPASQWLRTFARSLGDPEGSLAQWDQLARQEQRTFAQFPEQTSREIVWDLLRWQADFLSRLHRPQEALAVIRRSMDLLDGAREQVLDMVDWLIARSAWTAVEEVAQRFPDSFSADPVLLYRLAEARLQQGRKKEAEETAARCVELQPKNPEPHIESALWLQGRGMFEWSEREYRFVIMLGPRGSAPDLYSRFLLSEMLHDLDQPRRAADVLKGAVEAIDADANARKTVERLFRRQPGGVRSRMHYFYALDYASNGDREKQREHLEKGVEADPNDADVLIAMFRMADADAARREGTRRRIAAAADHFRKQILQLQQVAENPPNEAMRQEARSRLASANNQFAWLVSNTEGDFEEALKCSRRSLELRPDSAGYFDTLARCCYAVGDYVNAVKHQSRAAELEPHSGQIRRQLESLQKTLAESRSR